MVFDLRAITTYDMKGNLTRTLQVLNRLTNVTAADIAADADNVWTDPGVVDAHVYAGWYYDFLFKRFGRHGLDDRDLRIAILTHPVRLADLPTASPEVVGTYYDNAFFCGTCGPDGRGAITFGEGVPRGYFGNFEVKNFAAALDVVAHELTHGVTANSARLNGFPYSEAGALNEAFSDMIGLSTAFFYQPAGNAALQASYTVGQGPHRAGRRRRVPLDQQPWAVSAIPTTTRSGSSASIRTTTRRSRATRSIWPSRAGPTARRARRSRASAPPTAIRSRRRSSGRSPC